MHLVPGSIQRGAAHLLLTGLVFATAPARADTYTVPGDYATIKAALNACVSGDEVVLADGTYIGSDNRNLTFDGHDITLRSASGDPALCIIDCQTDGRGIFFVSGETPAAILDGITIRNGLVFDRGGGILVDHANPTIRNCVIEDCFTEFNGGAAYVNGGVASFTDCIFRRNEAFGDGGAIYAYEGAASPINGCAFDGNESFGQGGAIYNDVDWHVEISGTSFDGNDAGISGGAIHHEGGEMTIDGCSFSSNTSGLTGGAVMVAGAWLDVIDGTFTLNYAGGDGGAIAADPAILTVTDTGFLANAADGTGGGIFSAGILTTLTGCTFELNSAASDGAGGGAILHLDGELVMTSCDFEANRAVRLGGAVHNRGGTARAGACTFEENWTEQYTFPLHEGGGAIASDLDGTLTAIGCTFNRNESVGSGGAVLNAGAIAVIEGCGFENNTAEREGGAVSNGVTQAYPATIRGCRFETNESGSAGGAIHEGTGPITDCTFIGNTAPGGGAIFTFYGHFDVVNCRFLANLAPDTVGGAISTATGDWIIVNCTFIANVALRGGALSLFRNSLIVNCTFRGNREYAIYATDMDEVHNSILWENVPAAFDPAELPMVTFCDVEGGHVGTGNIATDPQFVNPDGTDGVPGTEDDDLRPGCTSPCIDAASNAVVPPDTADVDGDSITDEALPIDLAGNPRFADDPLTDDTGQGTAPIVDIGAYEHPHWPCPADFDESGDVGFQDLLALLSRWGPCPGCREDLDCDDDAGFGDLVRLLSTWGACP